MKTPAAIRQESGVALVTTVIVVAMLAVVAVALMQSTTIDRLSSRTSSNYFQAQLAAQAGLAEAMAAIAANSANFSYVTGAEPQGGGNTRTFIRPVDGSSGVWRFNGSPVYLDSGIGGDEARFIITGDRETPGVLRTAAWKTIERENPRPNETVRYAFFTDEAGSKQNLGWWGGGAARGVATNLADLALQLPDLTGESVAPFPASAAQSLSSLRTYSPTTFRFGNLLIPSLKANLELPSVATLNVASPAELDGRINGYFFALSSPSGASTPSGGVKLNIAALHRYIENLNSDQGADSPRARLVEQLLTPNSPEASNWGGGDLSWLATSGNYSPAEQKQIVANLIDYLDEDLIPTTDAKLGLPGNPSDIENPSYFGLEYKVDSSGAIIGHPIINYITIGLIFNKPAGGGGPNAGKINSTRVICSVGVTYPWSAQNWPTAAYEPEITIRVEGDVVNGLLGSDPEAYFLPDLNDPVTLLSAPSPTFQSFTGANFPQADGIAGSASYATRFFGFSAGDWPDRQPASISFNGVRFRIEKFRLKYTPTSGQTPGYVFVLPKDLVVELDPPNVAPGGPGPTSYFVKITEPTFKETENLYLSADPRAHFRESSWSKHASVTSFGKQIPEPAKGAASIDLDAGADPQRSDGAQGVTMDFGWFKNSSITNHFSRQSREGMSSIGEFGYLWTGKPWQTLNLTRTDSPPTEDWNLLDYVSAGRSAGGVVVATLPLGLIGPESEPASLVAQGGFNINTRKTATLSAVLQGAPDLSADASANIAQLPPTGLASPYGQIAEWTEKAGSLFAAGADTKFKREAAQRAMANIAVAQSRVFTIYTAGEYQQGTTRSRAYLEADVFLDVDPSTGNQRLKILSQRYN